MTIIKKISVSFYILIISLSIASFPMDIECHAQSLAEIQDNLENDLILFGYVLVCLYNSTDNKSIAQTRFNNFADDFKKYLKPKYDPYETKLGLNQQFYEFKVNEGIMSAKISSLMGCKHNINETIKIFNRLGISSSYLHQALQSY